MSYESPFVVEIKTSPVSATALAAARAARLARYQQLMNQPVTHPVQQHIRVQVTDSGRNEAGFSHESRDCTVRALATCLGIPYKDAHYKLARKGRKEGSGFFFRLSSLGKLGKQLSHRPDLCCRQLGKILPEMGRGRFIVRVKGHVFAVIDGVVYDNGFVGANSRVVMVYEKVEDSI